MKAIDNVLAFLKQNKSKELNSTWLESQQKCCFRLLSKII